MATILDFGVLKAAKFFYSQRRSRQSRTQPGVIDLVYGEYLQDPHAFRKILKAEFGIISNDLSSRLVISPLPLDRLLPGIEEVLKREGIEYKWIKPMDPILGLTRGNLALMIDDEPRYILFIGRASIEAVDRVWIIGHSNNVEEVLFIGAAASLKENLKPGSCNIPLYTIGIGDPSLAYAGLSSGLPVADKTLTQRIAKIAREAGCNTVSLLHASVPYFYIETRKFLQYLSDIGIFSIDMELAYVLRILDTFKKKAAGILLIEDMPLHGIEYMSQNYNNIRDSINRVKKEVVPGIVLRFLQS